MKEFFVEWVDELMELVISFELQKLDADDAILVLDAIIEFALGDSNKYKVLMLQAYWDAELTIRENRCCYFQELFLHYALS